MAIWMIKAKRHLRQSLASTFCTPFDQDAECHPDPTAAKIRELDEMLASTFPEAEHIIVRDQLRGFRQKENLFVLLIEVVQKEQGGPYVVKIGDAEKLNRESRGWESCRPVGLKNDLVLLPLTRHDCQDVAGKSDTVCLVYGDAQQFIGVDRTVFLEEAFLKSVQYGNPSARSIGHVFGELLERLGHLLYATSYVEDPAAEGYVFRMPKVVEAIEAWKKESLQQSIRVACNVLVNHGVSKFFDPVDYFLTWVLPWFAHQEKETNGDVRIVPARTVFAESPEDTGLADVDPTSSNLPQPKPCDLIPYMLRGCAHGDLHGRNILVGLVNKRVMWPTVFDYEDMSPCNLPGWDFVKLEHELKCRAYCEILPRQEEKFLEEVRDFELSLDELTEQHHLDGSWPRVEESAEPRDTLRGLILELRRMASLHLGKHRGRAKQWLEEYYFLLAAYAITTATYANLERRELVAAYVSAGVSIARLSWPRFRGPHDRGALGL
ncbi:MAG: hypothetical protein R6U98_02955 [Pirellulaceae bacterium]